MIPFHSSYDRFTVTQCGDDAVVAYHAAVKMRLDTDTMQFSRYHDALNGGAVLFFGASKIAQRIDFDFPVPRCPSYLIVNYWKACRGEHLLQSLLV